MVKVLSKGQRFMAHALSVVKDLCLNRTFTKRSIVVTLLAVLMTTARLLRSRMKRKFHVRFWSGGGVSDGPVDRNLGIYNF